MPKVKLLHISHAEKIEMLHGMRLDVSPCMYRPISITTPCSSVEHRVVLQLVKRTLKIHFDPSSALISPAPFNNDLILLPPHLPNTSGVLYTQLTH
jgi:hypothetical protein